MTRPLVSIAIPVWNGEETLPRLLESIRAQTYQPIDVHVVDDASTDATPNILQGYDWVKSSRHERNLGMTVSKNDAARHALGDYVFFVDDDMELVPDAVERCVRTCEAQGVDAVMIVERPRNAHAFWARCRGLDKAINWDDRQKSASRFMRRRILETVGERDCALQAAEDSDYEVRVRQAGFRSAAIREPLIYHDEPESLARIIRRAFDYGTTAVQYLSKRPADAIRQFAFPRPSYLRNARLLIQDPLLTAGWIVFKVIQLTAAVAGICYAAVTGRWIQAGQA